MKFRYFTQDTRLNKALKTWKGRRYALTFIERLRAARYKAARKMVAQKSNWIRRETR